MEEKKVSLLPPTPINDTDDKNNELSRSKNFNANYSWGCSTGNIDTPLKSVFVDPNDHLSLGNAVSDSRVSPTVDNRNLDIRFPISNHTPTATFDENNQNSLLNRVDENLSLPSFVNREIDVYSSLEPPLPRNANGVREKPCYSDSRASDPILEEIHRPSPACLSYNMYVDDSPFFRVANKKPLNSLRNIVNTREPSNDAGEFLESSLSRPISSIMRKHGKSKENSQSRLSTPLELQKNKFDGKKHGKRSKKWSVPLYSVIFPYVLVITIIAIATYFIATFVTESKMNSALNDLNAYLRTEIFNSIDSVSAIPVSLSSLYTFLRVQNTTAHSEWNQLIPTDNITNQALCRAMRESDRRNLVMQFLYVSLARGQAVICAQKSDSPYYASLRYSEKGTYYGLYPVNKTTLEFVPNQEALLDFKSSLTAKEISDKLGATLVAETFNDTIQNHKSIRAVDFWGAAHSLRTSLGFLSPFYEPNNSVGFFIAITDGQKLLEDFIAKSENIRKGASVMVVRGALYRKEQPFILASNWGQPEPRKEGWADYLIGNPRTIPLSHVSNPLMAEALKHIDIEEYIFRFQNFANIETYEEQVLLMKSEKIRTGYKTFRFGVQDAAVSVTHRASINNLRLVVVVATILPSYHGVSRVSYVYLAGNITLLVVLTSSLTVYFILHKCLEAPLRGIALQLREAGAIHNRTDYLCGAASITSPLIDFSDPLKDSPAQNSNSSEKRTFLERVLGRIHCLFNSIFRFELREVFMVRRHCETLRSRMLEVRTYLPEALFYQTSNPNELIFHGDSNAESILYKWNASLEQSLQIEANEIEKKKRLELEKPNTDQRFEETPLGTISRSPKKKSYQRRLCSLLGIHIDLQRGNESTLDYTGEIMETTVRCAAQFQGTIEIFVPESLYISFGSRNEMKDHAFSATRCAIAIFKSLSTGALERSTFVVDSGLYYVGMWGAVGRKGMALLGFPSAEMLFRQQLLSGFRIVVMANVVPFIRRHFRLLPFDMIYQTGSPDTALVLYCILNGPPITTQWLTMSARFKHGFNSMIKGDYTRALRTLEMIDQEEGVPFYIHNLFFICKERILRWKKNKIPKEEYTRRMNELQSSTIHSISVSNLDIPIGVRVPEELARCAIVPPFHHPLQNTEECSPSDVSSMEKGDQTKTSRKFRMGAFSTVSDFRISGKKNISWQAYASKSLHSNQVEFGAANVTTNSAKNTVDQNLGLSVSGTFPELKCDSMHLPTVIKDCNNNIWTRATPPFSSHGSTFPSFLGVSQTGTMAALKIYSVDLKMPVHHTNVANKSHSDSAFFTDYSKSVLEVTAPVLDPNENEATPSGGLFSVYVLDSSTREHVCINTTAVKNIKDNYYHENLIQYYDIVVVPKLPYVISIAEFFPGGTLRESTQRYGCALPLAAILRYSVSLLRGLDYLHRVKSTVHGNIKPENVIVGVDGNCKLKGMSYVYGWASQNPSLLEAIRRERLCYCSPEVIYGGKKTYASDIFSLGLLLLEMMCGKAPWTWSDEWSSSLTLANSIGGYPAPEFSRSMKEKTMNNLPPVNSAKRLKTVLEDNKLFRQAFVSGALELVRYDHNDIYNSKKIGKQSKKTIDSNLKSDTTSKSSKTPTYERVFMSKTQISECEVHYESNKLSFNSNTDFSYSNALQNSPGRTTFDREKLRKDDPETMRTLSAVLDGCLCFESKNRKSAADLLQMFSDM